MALPPSRASAACCPLHYVEGEQQAMFAYPAQLRRARQAFEVLRRSNARVRNARRAVESHARPL